MRNTTSKRSPINTEGLQCHSRCLQKKIHLYIKDNVALHYLYQFSCIKIYKGNSDNGLVTLNERRVTTGWRSLHFKTCLVHAH